MGESKKRRRATRQSRPDDSEAEARRRSVMTEALHLVAENGVAGASLRKLATRVGLSQPSLYHYFESKDDLIDQLVEMGARHMVDAMNLRQLPKVPLSKLPHVVKDAIFQLWKGDEHAAYTRFLFAVAIESPEHQSVIRRVFEDRLRHEPSDELAQIFSHDAALTPHLIECLMMQARAMGLCLIEERVLFGLSEPTEHTRRHADFIAEVVALALTTSPSNPTRSRARRRKR